MTKKAKKGCHLRKNRVTPSVAAPGDTNLSDTAAWTRASFSSAVISTNTNTDFNDHAFAVAGQRHGTDYQHQSGHLTFCRISGTNWKFTFSNGLFLFFSIHLEHGHPWIGLHVTPLKKLTLYCYYFSLYFMILTINFCVVWRTGSGGSLHTEHGHWSYIWPTDWSWDGTASIVCLCLLILWSHVLLLRCLLALLFVMTAARSIVMAHWIEWVEFNIPLGIV